MENKEYVKLLKDADIFSYSLAKGTFILPPNGSLLWDLIKNHLNSEFSKVGVRNVTFPTLIPSSLFVKEKEHVKGFSPEFFYVSKSKFKKDNPQDLDYLVLRPTSEVLFYHWFSERLRSYKDLPFLFNQWVQVFRAEKNNKPFLRSSEFSWQEGHTIHAFPEDSLRFMKIIISIYKKYIMAVLCLAIIAGVKSSLEKFPGAFETYAFECLLPDLQSLQLATVHYFSDLFSKAFSVKFNDHQNSTSYPFSTSWGTSTRAIGALALLHNDQHGIIFPSKVAPFQVAIIIATKNLEKDHSFLEFTEKVTSILSSSFRCKTYDQSSQFSTNVSSSEKEGCPIRVVIGEREFLSSSVSLYTRESPREKNIVEQKDLIERIEHSILKVDRFLFERSQKLLDNNVFMISSYQELVEKKKLLDRLFLVPFCNSSVCEEETKKNFPSYSFRCIDTSLEFTNESCIFCMRRTFGMSYFGRSY